jgi:hypothetical protein
MTTDTSADIAHKLAAKYRAALDIRRKIDREVRIDQIEAAARAAGVWPMFKAIVTGSAR